MAPGVFDVIDPVLLVEWNGSLTAPPRMSIGTQPLPIGAVGVPQVGTPFPSRKLGPSAFCRRPTIRLPSLRWIALVRPKLYDSSHFQFLSAGSTSSSIWPLRPLTMRKLSTL